MNALERQDWLNASSACLGLRLRSLRSSLAKLDALGGALRWEAALSPSGELSLVRLRCFGAGGGLKGWAARAAPLFGAGAPPPGGWRPASAGLPWLTIDWDGRSDSPRGLGFFGRRASRNEGWLCGPAKAARRVRFEEAAFSPKNFPEESLKRSFVEFHALCPILSVRLEWEADSRGLWKPARRWALRLKKPLAWPLFLRTDMAAAFAERGSQLSLLALDRKVSELAFETEELWAYFGA